VRNTDDEPNSPAGSAVGSSASDSADGAVTSGLEPAEPPVETDKPSVIPDAALPAPRPRLVVFASVALAALALDIVTKALVVAHLSHRSPVRLLGGAVYLVETRNSGAAFSLGTGATAIFTAIAIVVVAVIIRAARRLHSLGWSIALALVLGGALGNLVDRLVRAPGVGRGHVVDWISLFADDGHVWPIFNVADSAISCGGVLAVILALRGIEFDGKRASRSSRASAV
jgi:signal peptidase II